MDIGGLTVLDAKKIGQFFELDNNLRFWWSIVGSIFQKLLCILDISGSYV